ncbi:MAG: hypothetical protein ACPGXK_05230 [Phycisphaerae bacterium]
MKFALCILGLVFALTPSVRAGGAIGGDIPTQLQSTLEDFFVEGSQPSDETVFYDFFLTGSDCSICHELQQFQGDTTYIYKPWMGSMMAQSARDPIFQAALTISNQDAAFSGDLCIRCHTPRAWLDNRSTPTDGSALVAEDRDGVGCHVCHRMVDPVLQVTSPEPDEEILSLIDFLPVEPGNGNFVMDPVDRRRGPFVLPEFFQGHSWYESPYHQTSALCGTCHDVSNPVLQLQPDGTYRPNEMDMAHPTGDKYEMFPEQRTYSEWLMSEFASTGVDMEGRFGGPLNPVMSTCQDCHMPDTESLGCFIPGIPIRPDLPSHELAGGNTWVQMAVYDLYGDNPADDLNMDYLLAGIEASKSMLERACSLELEQEVSRVRVRVVNETGHKLPTGYPEGRRMWVNVRFFDSDMVLVAERGYYNPLTRQLEAGDTTVYRADHGLDDFMANLVGLSPGKSFHLVLNNKVIFDNRIPPRGYTHEKFESVQAEPVGAHYDDGEYWDDVYFDLPVGAAFAQARIYYQTTSREYAEFLSDANVTDSKGATAYDQWDKWGGSEPVLMASQLEVLDAFPDGDYDNNGVVDAADAASLISCRTEPFELPAPGCEIFDYDGDDDVDMADAAWLFRLYADEGS